MSVTSGWIVYGLCAVLAVVFWRRMRGRSLEDMFDAGAHEHHDVVKMLKKHPDGGAWRDVRAWMANARK